MLEVNSTYFVRMKPGFLDASPFISLRPQTNLRLIKRIHQTELRGIKFVLVSYDASNLIKYQYKTWFLLASQKNLNNETSRGTDVFTATCRVEL